MTPRDGVDRRYRLSKTRCRVEQSAQDMAVRVRERRAGMKDDEQWIKWCPRLASRGLPRAEWRAALVRGRELLAGPGGLCRRVGRGDPRRGSPDRTCDLSAALGGAVLVRTVGAPDVPGRPRHSDRQGI